MTTPTTWEATPEELVKEAEIAERDRIVAWLRSPAQICDCFAREADECVCGAWGDNKLMSVPDLASAIEHGDHLKDD